MSNNTTKPSSRFVAIDVATQKIFPSIKNVHAKALNAYLSGTPSNSFLRKIDLFIYEGLSGTTLLVPRNAVAKLRPIEYVRPRLFESGGVQASLAGGNLPSDVVDAVVNKAKRNGGKIGVAKALKGRSGGGANGFAFFELNGWPGLQIKISVNNLVQGHNLPRTPTNDPLYPLRKGAVRAGTELFLKTR